MSKKFSDFESSAVPGVQCLQPYQPGKPESELKREYGVTDIVKLASNENPLGPSPKAVEAINQSLHTLARYPDGAGFDLKQALSNRYGVGVEQITLGSGSSEVIELVARVFVNPGDEVIFSEHAFAMYPIITKAVGGQTVEVLASEWGHDLNAMLAAITENTRVIFVANPNNPTGTYLGGEALKRFISQVPENVIVVVDEAYFEFASDPALGAMDYPDTMNWLDEFPNLVVTRTFSKAFGLAGLRIGFSVSHKGVADLMNRIRPPFNTSIPAQVAALASLEDGEYLEKSKKINALGMAQLIAGFEQLGLDYIPSVGNFICVDVGQAGGVVYDALLHEGVIVRPVGNYGMPNHLRVSVGTAEENQRFLIALAKVLYK